MIPLKDLNPTTRPAVVTWILLAVNVLVFVFVQQAQRGTDVIPVAEGQAVEVDASLAFTLEYAAVPCEIVTGEPLEIEELRDTFVRGDDTACVEEDTGAPELFPEKRIYLAVLLSMFLHGGWLHLGGNMLFLWIFGNNIEDRLGPIRYLVFYLLGGFAAAAAHIAVQPASTVPVVGASGAIAAVMGAYLVWYPNAPIRTLFIMFLIFFVEIRAKWLLGFWFVLQFFTDASSGVAWVAHVGGFVFGVLVALLLRGGQRQRPTRLTYA